MLSEALAGQAGHICYVCHRDYIEIRRALRMHPKLHLQSKRPTNTPSECSNHGKRLIQALWICNPR